MRRLKGKGWVRVKGSGGDEGVAMQTLAQQLIHHAMHLNDKGDGRSAAIHDFGDDKTRPPIGKNVALDTGVVTWSARCQRKNCGRSLIVGAGSGGGVGGSAIDNRCDG